MQNSYEEKNMIIEGVLVRYLEWKGGSETPLLFLHGWRQQASIWKPIISKLHKENRSVWALNLPGFGGSEPLQKQQVMLSDYARCVVEFLKSVKHESVVVIGHSFGGRIAIKLAAEHQAIVKKLILIGSHGFVDDSLAKKIKNVLAKVIKPLFMFSTMQPLRRKMYKIIGAEDYVATPNLRKTFINIINEDVGSLLPLISQKTLLIWGENDTETPLAFGEKMQSKIPNSKLIKIPNSGHYPFLDNETACLTHIEKFIQE